LEILTKKISGLKGWDKNPRKISDQAFEGLKTSIERFGLVEPIIWNKQTDRVVGGHQRLKVLRANKEKETQVIVVDIPESEEKFLNVALNNQAISGTFSDEIEVLLEELEIENQELYKELRLDEIELPEPDQILMDVTEDEVPEPPVDPITKPGDLWLLGRHRVLCGDSTKKEDVDRLMDGKKADMVFTDPPYDLDEYDFIQTIETKSANAYVFVMGSDKQVQGVLRKTKLELQRFFILDHTFSSPKGNDAYVRHILLMRLVNGKVQPFKNLGDGLQSIIKMNYRGFLSREENSYHKHQKPASIVRTFLRHYSDENNLVLDVFLGSGTTLIAAEQLDRICYGMEIEPKYCDVIVERWENLTGEKAVLDA